MVEAEVWLLTGGAMGATGTKGCGVGGCAVFRILPQPSSRARWQPDCFPHSVLVEPRLWGWVNVVGLWGSPAPVGRRLAEPPCPFTYVRFIYQVRPLCRSCEPWGSLPSGALDLLALHWPEPP